MNAPARRPAQSAGLDGAPRPSDLSYGVLDTRPLRRPSRRFFGGAPGRRWREAEGYQPDDPGVDWDELTARASAEALAATFSLGELVQLLPAAGPDSDLHRWMDATHPLVTKVQSSHWRFGYGRDPARQAAHLAALGRLAFDAPGVEVRLTWTRDVAAHGYSVHQRDLYLDAPLGLLFCRGGAPLLTVGFGLSPHGVFLAQVQSEVARGNRFLFSLPGHPLDVALGVLARAFPQERLWLPTGRSAVEGVRHAYGRGPCPLTPEVEARIAALYDRPLAAFARLRGPGRSFHVREYLGLVPLDPGAAPVARGPA